MRTSFYSSFRLVLFVLFFYIIAQLTWWSFLIIELTQQVYADDPRLSLKNTMIIGEGIVFIMIMLLGFIYTYKAFLKEVVLAQRQQNFMLSVTHEFKTPLASLRLYLETLIKRELPAARKEEILQKALGDTERLHALTENILLATRIDLNAYPLQRQTRNLSAFVEALSDNLTGSIGANYETHKEIEPEIFFAFDELAMSSIFCNLYENAVKYSDPGARIRIALYREADQIKLSVSDQGSGIPAAARKKIFGKFFRVGNEETRSSKGTGLGLFIVKNFTALHQGKIEVRDNTPKGTVFEISFPFH